MDKLNFYKNQYESRLLQYDFFHKIKESTNIDAVYIAGVAIGLCSTIIYFAAGFDFLSKLITFIPPAYKSYKAIENNATEERANTQWLTYWVIWAFVVLLESGGNFLYYIVPYYDFLKTSFLIWLWKFNGAQYVYEHAIRPVMKSQEENVDNAIEVTQDAVKSGMNEASNAASQKLKSAQNTIQKKIESKKADADWKNVDNNPASSGANVSQQGQQGQQVGNTSYVGNAGYAGNTGNAGYVAPVGPAAPAGPNVPAGNYQQGNVPRDWKATSMDFKAETMPPEWSKYETTGKAIDLAANRPENAVKPIELKKVE